MQAKHQTSKSQNKNPDFSALGSFCAIACISTLLGLLFLSGCSWFADNRVRITNPKFNATSPEHREMLSKVLSNRYFSEIIRMMQAEEEYRKYLQTIENDQGKSICKDDCALERRH